MKIPRVITINILLLLYGCIMPKSPNWLYCKLNDYENYETEAYYGKAYDVSGYYMNLWFFSTSWKSVYFTTNIPVEHGMVTIVVDDKILILKEIPKDDLELLPHKFYNDDSVKVYSIILKGKEIKNDSKMVVYLNKELVFEKQ